MAIDRHVQEEKSSQRGHVSFLPTPAEWAKRLFSTVNKHRVHVAIFQAYGCTTPKSQTNVLVSQCCTEAGNWSIKGPVLRILLFCQWGTQHQGRWMSRWVLDNLRKVNKQQGEREGPFQISICALFALTLSLV